MRLLDVKMTVRRMMCVVAVVGLALGIADAVRMSNRAANYRRLASWCDHMERRCRKIDAMDAVTRVREAEAAFDDPYLEMPAWNREMILYYARLKRIYDHAAAHPRLPIPRDSLAH